MMISAKIPWSLWKDIPILQCLVWITGVHNYQEGNSDVVMIACIDNKTKNVKLVSVYRDTFLSVGGGTYFKCNNAYARGGAKQAVQMLNSNLDLDIK